jgi:membrane glycosyltransferase
MPGDFWWYLPLLVGLASAILLGWLTSLRAAGAAARRRGLFVVPSENADLAIVNRVDALVAEGGRGKRALRDDAAPNGEALLTA